MGAVDVAIQFISKKHNGQYRKGLNIPYNPFVWRSKNFENSRL